MLPLLAAVLAQAEQTITATPIYDPVSTGIAIGGPMGTAYLIGLIVKPFVEAWRLARKEKRDGKALTPADVEAAVARAERETEARVESRANLRFLAENSKTTMQLLERLTVANERVTVAVEQLAGGVQEIREDVDQMLRPVR